MTAPDTKVSNEFPLIASELRRMYKGPAWHGPSFQDAVRDVSPSAAVARPIPNGHSIFEIVHHIGAWIGEVESRLRGNPGGNPADGDWPATTDVDAGTWREALDRVEARQNSLLALVRTLDPARLHEVVEPNASSPANRKVTAYILLHGLVQHNAYHIGQIVLLKKATA